MSAFYIVAHFVLVLGNYSALQLGIAVFFADLVDALFHGVALIIVPARLVESQLRLAVKSEKACSAISPQSAV